jgi:hypothetical protein
LQELITSSEFQDWKIFYSIEPPRTVRAQYEAASICAAIVNVNRDKHHSPAKLQDFLVEFKRREIGEGTSAELLEKKMQAWHAMITGAKGDVK